MSLHSSPFSNLFVTPFGKQLHNFLFRRADRFVDALKADVFLLGNLPDSQPLHAKQPQSAELGFAQAALDAGNLLGVQPLLFLPVIDVLQHSIDALNGNAITSKALDGYGVVGVNVVPLLSFVIVRIGPAFPAQKLILAGKVLTGQPDDVLVRIYVNDGGDVLLVKGIVALSVEHCCSSVSENLW